MEDHNDRIRKLEHLVYGNGDLGIAGDVKMLKQYVEKQERALDEQRKTRKMVFWSVVVQIIAGGSFIAYILSALTKIIK